MAVVLDMLKAVSRLLLQGELSAAAATVSSLLLCLT